MKNLFIAATVLCMIILYACQKSADSTNQSTIQIRMTDAPFEAQQVNVDLQQVRIKYREDSSWSVLNTNAGIYNLLQFQNGLDTLIATGSIPSGSTIKEVRFILGNNNTIMIDSIVYPLTIPGGADSGLKIKVNKKMAQSFEDILLDFDANLSIHKTGNGAYLLKPVIKVKR